MTLSVMPKAAAARAFWNKARCTWEEEEMEEEEEEEQQQQQEYDEQE